MTERQERSAVHDLSQDTLGFGMLEVRTAWDVTRRPRPLLEGWMRGGATAAGAYATPLRLYLALNAILMLILFLRGGADFMLADLPAAYVAELVERSGKSTDAFMADADNWMTFVMVPLLSAGYALAAAPLLRWWDPDDLGWRRGFRAAFAWLCAWTTTIMPLAWWGLGRGPIQMVVSFVIVLLGLVAFIRMGRGRWFRSTLAGLGKAVVLLTAVQLGGAAGGSLVIGIGLGAAVFMP